MTMQHVPMNLLRLVVLSVLLWSAGGRAQAQAPSFQNIPEIPDILRPAECGPNARISRFPPLCPGRLPAACLAGRWVCETCNGRDDTGRSVPDEGRDQLCDLPLSDDECGPARCQRAPDRVERDASGLLRVVYSTACRYPETSAACDDGNRCTTESCSAGHCQYTPIASCANLTVDASVRRFQIESWLELRLGGATPSAVHEVRIVGVPDFPDRVRRVTTDASGLASLREIYPYYTGLPSTCGRSLPAVSISVVQVATTSNRATDSVAATSLRPCLVVP